MMPLTYVNLFFATWIAWIVCVNATWSGVVTTKISSAAFMAAIISSFKFGEESIMVKSYSSLHLLMYKAKSSGLTFLSSKVPAKMCKFLVSFCAATAGSSCDWRTS